MRNSWTASWSTIQWSTSHYQTPSNNDMRQWRRFSRAAPSTRRLRTISCVPSMQCHAQTRSFAPTSIVTRSSSTSIRGGARRRNWPVANAFGSTKTTIAFMGTSPQRLSPTPGFATTTSCATCCSTRHRWWRVSLHSSKSVAVCRSAWSRTDRLASSC